MRSRPRDNPELRRLSDAKVQQLVTDLRAHRDQGVCAIGQHSLQLDEGSLLWTGEVALEHVAVERVHEHRGRAASKSAQSGQPADAPRLCHVRVD